MAREQLFGRHDLVEKVLGASPASKPVFDLVGNHGSGKTSIARHLAPDPATFRQIRVDLEVFNPGHPGDAGPKASVGAVQASFHQFRALLEELIDRTCTPTAAEQFRKEVHDALNELRARRVLSMDLAMDEVASRLTPDDLAEAWETSAVEVTKRFVGHWNDPADWLEPGDDRTHLLLFDNVDEVVDQKLGEWLGQLLPDLEQTIVVLTRLPDRPLPSLATMGTRLTEEAVPPFDAEDVYKYLNDAKADSVDHDLARRIHHITDGHPGTISIVHEIMWGPGLGGAAAAEAVLRQAESEPDRVAFLIDQLVRSQKEQALVLALSAAVVPRRFDVELLKALLEEDEVPDRDVPEVFETLGRFAFIEDVTRPDDGHKWLRVHSYVRGGLLERMKNQEPERINALHDRAAEFHSRTLTATSDTEASFGYEEAYVYEKPGWQRTKREWLYHRAHAHGDQQRQAALEFTRVFLEAFWWWGNYIHFDFCDQLVADLGQIAKRSGPRVSDRLGDLHQASQDLLANYPPRSSKVTGSWDEVNQALLAIQQACGLSGSRTPKTEEQQKVSALLNVFLAHSWRYRKPPDMAADGYYAKADALLGQLEETWSQAWVAFERAELRLSLVKDAPPAQLDAWLAEHGDEFRALWEHAAGIVQPTGDADETPDDELIANLHRLRGDLCWSLGLHARAATWYRRAVLHAYLFHGTVDEDGLIAPDEYTLQFYVDIRARALNRILALMEEKRLVDANAFALELAEVFADTTRRGHDPEAVARQVAEHLAVDVKQVAPLQLAEALFPAGPEVPDLGQSKSAFMAEYAARQEAVDYEVASCDLHDQWP